MKNKIVMAMMGVMMAFLTATSGLVAPVFAVTCPEGTKRAPEDVSSYAECNLDPSASSADSMDNTWKTVETIIDWAMALVGLVAVIMVIVGGYKVATSGGASDKIKSGKDTIIYGLIGMVIVLLAYVIVNFVLGAVFGG